MSNTVQTYLNLITSEHQGQPDFEAMVSLGVSLPVRVQDLLDSMIRIFDLDFPPVGDQLDIIGLWVGISRNVSVPITGVLFSWDGDDSIGWDFGIWQDPSNPTAVTILPDDVYLTVIKAKIAANSWDGTTEGAYKIYGIVFPDLIILIQDNQNMSYAIAIVGTVLDSLTQALLVGGYFKLKPEGVRISEYFFPITTDPLFGWDIENDNIQGWEVGFWAMEF